MFLCLKAAADRGVLSRTLAEQFEAALADGECLAAIDALIIGNDCEQEVREMATAFLQLMNENPPELEHGK
jgi:hypothetical protein